jgi:hypothetical protein
MKPFRPKFSDQTYFGHISVCNCDLSKMASKCLGIQDYLLSMIVEQICMCTFEATFISGFTHWWTNSQIRLKCNAPGRDTYFHNNVYNNIRKI